MVTLNEIAEMAGVSRGTVDRVLNDRNGVSAKTKERVLQIANALGYSPNMAARGLAIRKKSLRFGVYLYNDRPIFKEVERGVAQSASRLAEFGISVTSAKGAHTDVDAQMKFLKEMQDQHFDGIILPPIGAEIIASKIREVSSSGIPVVTYYHDISDCGRIAFVGGDNINFGQTAAGLIGILTGGVGNVLILSNDSTDSMIQRVDGFTKKIRKCYPNINIVDSIYNVDDDFKNYALMTEYLEKGMHIDAVFLNTVYPLGFCRAIEEHKTKIKTVCFYHDEEIHEFLKKGLIDISIDQHPIFQGTKPLDILFDYYVYGKYSGNETTYIKAQILTIDNI